MVMSMYLSIMGRILLCSRDVFSQVYCTILLILVEDVVQWSKNLNYTIDGGLILTTSLFPAFLQVHVSETFVSIFSLTPTVRFLYWSSDVSYLTVKNLTVGVRLKMETKVSVTCTCKKDLLILQPFLSLHLRHNLFSNPSVALPTSQLILQPFRCFTYITVHSPILLSLLLCHKFFT